MLPMPTMPAAPRSPCPEADAPPISVPQGDDDAFSTSSAGSRSTDCSSEDLRRGTEGEGAHADLVKEQQEGIARAETRSVRSLRAIVLVVLVLSAVGVALAVYFYTSTTEQAQFERGFEGDVVKVFDGIGRSIENTLVNLDTFQTTIASEAKATGQRWPFVTVPDFAVRGTKIRMQSDGYSISYSVLVTRGQKSEWEAYALNHSGWVNESMAFQERSPNYYGPVMYNHTISEVIWGDYAQESEQDVFLPNWQTDPSTSNGKQEGSVPSHRTAHDWGGTRRREAPSSPTRPFVVATFELLTVVTRVPAFNYDLLRLFDPEPVERPFVTRKAVLGGVYGLPNMSNPEEVLDNDNWVDWLRDYVPPDEDPSEPNSEFYYPIFGSVDDHRENGTERQVVGLIWLGFFWRDMLTDLLPQDSAGIDVVVSNPCSASFTYRLDGQWPTFMGAGDLHEAQFDRYGTNSTVIGLKEYSVSKSSYTGVPVDEEFCPMLITVYPSSATLSTYTTTNRIVFTVCSVLIFAFTSVVFILYDKSVERRQNKVMKTAVRAETIVQSLFPAVVRDRIYPTADANSGGNKKTPKSEFNVANSKAKIQSFLGGDGDNGDVIEGGDFTASPPVADLFPDCTVMFADIVGTFDSAMSTRCYRNCHS
jgi:hypothetical protein